MVRSLVGTWKFPYFCDFDTPMTKPLFHEIIVDIEGTGCKVLASTSDQGGSNEGLKKDLGTVFKNLQKCVCNFPSKIFSWLIIFNI